MATETLLTRKDDNLGDGFFDSIAGAFSEHLKEPDNQMFHSAVMYGNEDNPGRIDFYRNSEPCITDAPERIWIGGGSL